MAIEKITAFPSKAQEESNYKQSIKRTQEIVGALKSGFALTFDLNTKNLRLVGYNIQPSQIIAALEEQKLKLLLDSIRSES